MLFGLEYKTWGQIIEIVLLVVIIILLIYGVNKASFYGGRGLQVVNSGPNARYYTARDDPGHETVHYNPYKGMRHHQYMRWRENPVDHPTGEHFLGSPMGPNIWEIGKELRDDQRHLNAWHLNESHAKATGQHNAFTESKLEDELRKNN